MQEDRGEMLAVLAVSPDMGVADFCTWAGAMIADFFGDATCSMLLKTCAFSLLPPKRVAGP